MLPYSSDIIEWIMGVVFDICRTGVTLWDKSPVSWLQGWYTHTHIRLVIPSITAPYTLTRPNTQTTPSHTNNSHTHKQHTQSKLSIPSITAPNTQTALLHTNKALTTHSTQTPFLYVLYTYIVQYTIPIHR